MMTAWNFAADLDARHALMGLICRVVDDIRFGIRPLDVEEVRTLTLAWADLNSGATAAELALRELRDPAE